MAKIKVKDKYAHLSKDIGKYGRFHYLEILSGGDITKWDEVKQINYNDAFYALSYRRMNSKVMQDIRDQIELENKTK